MNRALWVCHTNTSLQAQATLVSITLGYKLVLNIRKNSIVYALNICKIFCFLYIFFDVYIILLYLF